MDFLSLRSTGKAISGKVYKGSNKKSDFDISPFSNNFPLNNEDKKEFNIFGSFNQIYPIINHEPPGPGDYNILSSCSPSFSKRGYGGLINRAPRFNKKNKGTNSPGPGSYDEQPTQKKAISSVFMSPKTTSPIKNCLPSPGQYDPIQITNQRGSESVFKSKSERLKMIDNDFPPPWQYSPNLPSHSTAVVIKNPYNLRKKPLNLYDPFAETPKFEVTPGPGDYEIEKSHSRMQPSCMFNKGNSDRFGAYTKKNAKKKLSPGPGAYFNEISNEKSLIFHSVFASNSERMLSIKKHMPGPAYYSPKNPDKKKSFLCNIKSIWS